MNVPGRSQGAYLYMSSSAMKPSQIFFAITFLFRKYTTNSTPVGWNRTPTALAMESKIKHNTTLASESSSFFFVNLSGKETSCDYYYFMCERKRKEKKKTLKSESVS